MGRNLVICPDGTRNEPETGATNVARLYGIAQKSDEQLVYYDPGVGTMGDLAAATRLGAVVDPRPGLVVGHGVKESIEEAYRFLMYTYQPGDRVFVFGFSRGAYTARAPVGMLRTVGLLHSDADNLVPYAMKLYTRQGRQEPEREGGEGLLAAAVGVHRSVRRPDFPDAFSPQIGSSALGTRPRASAG
jgi:uncharacterized protein (DUF2235 family)